MKKRILVIGGEGAVDSVLFRALDPFADVSVYDLPESDLGNREQLLNAMKCADIVIYAALAKAESGEPRESWRSKVINTKNIMYEKSVLSMLEQASVERYVYMSSVHAKYFYDHVPGEELITVDDSDVTHIESPYGVRKKYMEFDIKHTLALTSIEAVCVRLGGVTWNNSVRQTAQEPRVWISHADLGRLIRSACFSELRVQYEILYGVSRNLEPIFDTSNSIGWEPRDKSCDFPYFTEKKSS